MADVKRLAHKKSLTGKELGILQIANTAIKYRQQINGEEEKDIIDSKRFRELLEEITDPVQYGIYKGYTAIYEWLVVAFNIAQTQIQQAQGRYNTLFGIVSRAMLSESVFRFASKLPYIVTAKQYEDIKAERLEAHYKDEDGQELYCNTFDLIERALAYYLYKLKHEPRKANPLKAIRKSYLAQPVKSKLILSRYNKVTGWGYYTLPDGRRSDTMTDEEWQKAITTPEMYKTLQEMDKDPESEERAFQIALKRYVLKTKVIFNGGTEEEADRLQEEQDYREGLATPVKWHYYTDPPEDLTKWELIEEELLSDFYPANMGGEDPFTASLEDFYTEFKELVDTLLKDMDSRYGLQTSQLQPSEWRSYKVSYRRLYELNFYGDRDFAESDLWAFNDNKRALDNGIAIVKPIHGIETDEKGYYKEPTLTEKLYEASLESFFPESEEYEGSVSQIEEAKETFLNSYYYVLGFNYIIERVADLYDVPDMKVFILPIEEEIGGRMDACNALVPILYTQIKDTNYRDEELKERKMKVLQDYFQPVDYKALTLPEESKRELEELLKDFRSFGADGQHSLFSFMHRPKGEGA